MKNYQAFVIDLDGTMYRGNERVEGASEFVHHLKNHNIPLMFLTNNSSKTADQIATKLVTMGIPAMPEEIFTSSIATAEYVKNQMKQARIHVIGEEGLFEALKSEGHSIVEENADYVVMGIDREISYKKLTSACLHVRKGATLLSTNADVAIPTERGMIPGNGALTSVISVSTGVEPVVIGKPNAIIMEQALQRLGYQKEDVLMVGDNYNTDILAGIHAGCDTLMVGTGVSTFDEIRDFEKQPTYQTKNLLDWMKD